MSSNSDIAKALREIAFFLSMQGVEFKPRAYERVADEIDTLGGPLTERYRDGGLKLLMEIPGVGQAIAEKIEQLIKTGKISQLEELRAEFPIDLDSLTGIEGLGPKTIAKLYREAGIKNRKELQFAVESGSLSAKGIIGKKVEANILRRLEFLKKGTGRLILGFVMPVAQTIIAKLSAVPDTQAVELAGSARRMQETVGDFDFLAISNDPEKLMDVFTRLPEVTEVLSRGPTRSSVRLTLGIDADLRVVPPESFGAALQYFTGDKYHNIKLREIAVSKGYKLNEYGLYKGKKIIEAKSEREIYHRLGLIWMPPELRTDHGEIEAALSGELPKLVEYGQIKGDLQVHSTWTDGNRSIREMALAAQKLGWEYICITDHTKSLAVTDGNDEGEIIEQMAEIDEIQKEFKNFKILKGAEVNILPDGTLDTDDEVLAKLDVVGAAVHSKMNMTEAEMTARIIRAMENPHVDIIFHPTGRLVSRRNAYPVDIEAIISAARRTGTVLEIDGFPERLDLKDEYIRKVVVAGVKLSIGSDAHDIPHLEYLRYGIGQARRGWATADDIITTRPWPEMLKLLKK